MKFKYPLKHESLKSYPYHLTHQQMWSTMACVQSDVPRSTYTRCRGLRWIGRGKYRAGGLWRRWGKWDETTAKRFFWPRLLLSLIVSVLKLLCLHKRDQEENTNQATMLSLIISSTLNQIQAAPLRPYLSVTQICFVSSSKSPGKVRVRCRSNFPDFVTSFNLPSRCKVQGERLFSRLDWKSWILSD